VHADADVHDTAPRELNCAPDGLGVAWISHALPFHRSARAPAFDPPTAVHAEDEVQATLDSPPPPEGLGVGWIHHALPFHDSARVPALEKPTAVQDEADWQATPVRVPPPCEGLGVARIRHALPFQLSAKGPPFELPTAVHAEGEVHATLLSRPPPDPGLGVAWIRHALPFHRSARGTDTPELLRAWPTAVHAEGDEQDTLRSALSLAPEGLAAAWVAHLPPSRRSARVTTTPEPVVKSPTAVQEDDPEQETPTSWPVRAARFWVGTVDHPDFGVAADGDDETVRLVRAAAALPRADAANAATARNPKGSSLATKRDSENRLRAEFMSTPRIRCCVSPRLIWIDREDPRAGGLLVDGEVPWLTGWWPAWPPRLLAGPHKCRGGRDPDGSDDAPALSHEFSPCVLGLRSCWFLSGCFGAG
jgi:hypothetical protein